MASPNYSMEDQNNIPAESAENNVNTPPEEMSAPPAATADVDEEMDERLERLGGEPAPVITPEEFARLQKAGQVHIDARGRVRTTRRSGAEAGVSLRKRRAWYAVPTAAGYGRF